MLKLVHSTLLVRVYKIKMSLYRTITQYYFRRVFTLTMEKLLEKTIIIVLNVVGFVKVSNKNGPKSQKWMLHSLDFSWKRTLINNYSSYFPSNFPSDNHK